MTTFSYLIIILLIVYNESQSSYSNRTLSSSQQSRTLSSIKYVHYPDVFFIGAMKAASTSFHNLLIETSNNMVLISIIHIYISSSSSSSSK